MIRLATLTAGLFAMVAGTADATPLRCTLVDDRFAPVAAAISTITAERVEYIDESTGKAATLPLARLVRIETAAPSHKPRAEDGGFAFVFRDGQRWYGAPGAMDGDAIKCRPGSTSRTAGAKATLVPLKDVEAIVGVADLGRFLAAAPRSVTADELQLANGDALVGVVSASDAERVTVQTPDGTQVPVAWGSVRRATLSPVNDGATAAKPLPFRVYGADGTVRDASAITFDGDNAVEFVDGAKVKSVLPAGEVQAIEYVAGNARPLSRVAPLSQTDQPYFPRTGGGTAAARGADAISVAGYRTRSYVAVRPRGARTWALDGSAKRFVTRYGIADGRPLADVTVRVRLDGKVVHERAGVKSGVVSDPMAVDLGAARSLTLEVDFGENYDVQDEFYWLDPTLLAE